MKARLLLILLGLVLVGAACSDSSNATRVSSDKPASSDDPPAGDCETRYSGHEQYSERMRCLRGETSEASSADADDEDEEAAVADPISPKGTGSLVPTAPPTSTRVTLPTNTFEVRYAGSTYLCRPENNLSYSNNSDCVRYSGGAAPSFYSPDIYCSGPKYSPECSELWYPDELDDYEIINMGGRMYLCKNAVLGGGIGDKDCAPYSGGDPDRVSFFSALKCSPDVGGLRCDEEYYPSEMEGLSVVRIDYKDYVCKDTYQGDACYRWYGTGSPKSATYGLPDLYCNRSGVCAEDGYPSGY